jgi:leader peptidase (prepilin peptidase) / N-methyltransferase
MTWLFIFFTCVLGIIAICISWIDFRQQIIPDALNGALAFGGIAALAASEKITLADAVFGVLVGFLVPFTLALAYQWLRGISGLGMGDIKFLAASGFWIGVTGLPWLILFASLSGLIFALAKLAVVGDVSTQTRLAFGPHLAVALFATWIFKGFQIL